MAEIPTDIASAETLLSSTWNFFTGTLLGKIAMIILILIFAFVFERILRMILTKYFDRLSKYTKIDSTQYNFLKNSLTVVIYGAAIALAIYNIPSLRSLSVSLFAGAGVLAIVIGFGAQEAFSNVISGVFIITSKPYRVGDWIQVQNTRSGIVEDITLRHTVIRDFQNKRIIIPNSIMNSETIENYDIGDSKICEFVEIGISYDSNIDKAMKIMQEEARKHPNFIDVRTKKEKEEGEPDVTAKVIGFGDSSVNLRAWVWGENPKKARRMKWDLNKSIKQRFDKEGIEIPFPYRTIVYKKDLK